VLDGADDGYIGVMVDDFAQLGLMPAATEIVEDDARNADVLVESLVTQDQRCNARMTPAMRMSLSKAW
jgi:hypothetical protein